MSQGGSTQRGSGGSGGGSITLSREIFTSDGTYTPTLGMIYCLVEIVGGGGGAGGTDEIVDSSNVIAGSGGGAGGYSNGIFDAATIGASQSISIGVGGLGLTGTGSGQGGGTTTFGSLMTGFGGFAGITFGEVPAAAVSAGGLGGSSSGGDYQITGQRGSGGFGYIVNTPAAFGTILLACGGSGGSSPLGLGGCTVYSISPGQTAFPGVNASGYGAGGSSACSVYNPIPEPQQAGGNGTSGICIVTEYIGTSPSPVGSNWVLTNSSLTMAINTGYIANSASLINLTMPLTAPVGSIIEVCGRGSGGWSIILNSGQSIVYNSSTSTTSISSSIPTDTLRIVCTVANTSFNVLSGDGNPTIL